MSTHYEFTVSPEGKIPIVLPPEFRGKAVRISIEEMPESPSANPSHEARPIGSEQKGIFSLIGVLGKSAMEPTGDPRYDALMERYKRARNID